MQFQKILATLIACILCIATIIAVAPTKVSVIPRVPGISLASDAPPPHIED